MNPLDETWQLTDFKVTPNGSFAKKVGASKDGVVPYVSWNDHEGGIFQSETYAMKKYVDESRERLPARLRLASAAPDMARELIALEWCESQCIDYEWHSPACPSCGGIEPDRWTGDTVRRIEGEGFIVGHKPDCSLVAALKKAGMR